MRMSLCVSVLQSCCETLVIVEAGKKAPKLEMRPAMGSSIWVSTGHTHMGIHAEL